LTGQEPDSGVASKPGQPAETPGKEAGGESRAGAGKEAGKESAKEAELAERKRELEEELEAYARAGVVSPGMLKSAKWLSRGLYMAMAAVVVFLLFSGWGKHSQQTVDELQQSRDAWKKSADGFKSEKKTLEERLSDLVVDAAQAEAARRQAEAQSQGPQVADAAQRAARALVERMWGEQAYTRHWRELLKRAEPEAHGDARSGAIAMLEQAQTAPARQRIELMRELADFGAEGVGAAARGLVVSEHEEVKQVAALALARLGRQEDIALLDKKAAESDNPDAAREMYFAASMLLIEAGTDGATNPLAVDYPEYWLRYAMRSFEGRQDELAARYRAAPALELLALLGECGGADIEPVMREVAISQTRPGAERILAVRWLAERKLARELLNTLAEEDSPVGAEAKKGSGK